MPTPKQKFRRHEREDFLFLGESRRTEEFIISLVVLLIFGVINLIHIFAQEIPVETEIAGGTTGEISIETGMIAIVPEISGEITVPVLTQELPIETGIVPVPPEISGEVIVPAPEAVIVPEPEAMAVPASKEDFQAVMDVLEHPSEEMNAVDEAAAERGYISGEIVVKFRPSKVNLKSAQGSAFAESFAVTQDMQQVENVDVSNISLMKIDETQDIEQKIDELRTDPNVEYAEPNYVYYPLVFNDTYIKDLRGLDKIKRYEAQNLYSGNLTATGAIVAVLDIGVAYDHPDLSNQMRDGTTCKSDTGAVLGGCLHGYDFAGDDKDPYPIDSDHGTHIAGTIAAQANNSRGIVGVNYNARIMAIKAGDEMGFEMIDIIKGINFARQNGARIINASFGGPSYSSGIYDAINSFRTAGGLFIAAAGNDAVNHDGGIRNYPCDFTLDNIICVAATDSSDQLSSFSDYGQTSVDLGAPGQQIFSMTIGKTVIDAPLSGSVPVGRTMGGVGANRGMRMLTGGTKKFFADADIPYANNVDSTLTGIADTSDADDISIEFTSECDTQYSIPRTDYMEFGVSADGGTTFRTPFKRDEQYLDSKKLEQDPSGASSYDFSLPLTGTYASTGMVFRFRWVTDGSDNEYSGCSISDFRIRKYKEGAGYEEYVYKDGTSMAAPHAAGLASLARSAAPGLTYIQLRSMIMETGDPLTGLAGKTVSGRRINARNLMNAVIYSGQAAKLLPIAQYLSGRGIRTNLDTVKDSTIPIFSGLYFAKMSGSDELGRIIFPSEINLFDTGIQEFISGDLADNLGMAPGQARFIPGTGFIGRKGIIKMNISSMYAGFLGITGNMNPDIFTVKSGSGAGAPISNSVITDVASGGACTAGDFGCSIYLRVDHFTRFDLKPLLTNVHIGSDYIDPSYASLWNTVTLSFTGGETLSGVRVTINGQSVVTIGSGRSRSASYYITKINENGLVPFTIDYYDVTNTAGFTVTGTTDGSAVFMYHNAPAIPTIESMTITTGGKVILAGIADTGNLVEIRRRNSYAAAESSLGTYVASGVSNGTYIILAPLTGGLNVFRAYAKNIYGSTFTGWTSTGSISTGIIKDETPPTALIEYVPGSGAMMTGSVRASLTGFSEEVMGLNATGYTFTRNGTFLFTFTDLAGNRGIATGRVTRLDNEAPVPTFSFSPASGTATSGNVTLSIAFNEPATLTDGSTGRTFVDNGAYTIGFTDALGNAGTGTAIVNRIDRTQPSITLTSSTSTASGSIILAGTGSDNFSLAKIYVNGSLVAGTGSWSTGVALAGGVNTFVISGFDFAGNSTGIVFTITRLPFVSDIAAEVISSTGAKISFTSDINATGYVAYGTSSLTMIAQGSLGTTHTIALTGLIPNVTYYYKVYSKSNGLTGSISSTRTLVFPYIIPIRGSSDITTTGIVDIGGGSFSSFESNGILRLFGSGSTTDYLEINLDYLGVQSDSGSRNGVIHGPVHTDFFGDEPSNIDYVHELDLTYAIGAEDTEILFVGNRATVKLYVGTQFNNKKLRVFRSSTGEWYNRIDTCYVTGGYCLFETDALGYFTMMSPLANPNAHGAASQGSIAGSTYDDELNNAYLYSYRRAITTIPYINRANMTGSLIREQLAKMIVNYAAKILEKEPDFSKECYFSDLAGVSTELKSYIKLACQMGLMGVGIDKFYPKNKVTRAEFGTILSRALRGEIYNQEGADYYSSHLNALNEQGIVKQTSNPWTIELRGRVMIMMKRAEDSL